MENKSLVLLGGGGHCKSVLDSILRGNEYSDIVITDNNLAAGTKIYGCKVVGTDAFLPDLREKGYKNAFITVGSINNTSVGVRMKLANLASSLGFSFPTIVDPSAIVSKHARIAAGTYIGKNAVINADAVIGTQCIINTGAIVEHECQIGDFTHVSVGAILCGNVKVGRESFIGAGATVIQGIHIGNLVIVGANSTVLSDVYDGKIRVSGR
jgi:sugar O-acyltransferase (sialic acid O-acetyltransferase NeuD family)